MFSIIVDIQHKKLKTIIQLGLSLLCHKHHNAIVRLRLYIMLLLFLPCVGMRMHVHNACFCSHSWWRHQMETFSALLALCAGNSPVPGEFPAQRPVTRSFDVFFVLCLNQRLSKQSRGWWFETQSRPLWRHRNVIRPSDKMDVIHGNKITFNDIFTAIGVVHGLYNQIKGIIKRYGCERINPVPIWCKGIWNHHDDVDILVMSGVF